MRNRLISLALMCALLLAPISEAPASQATTCPPTTGTVSGLTFSQVVGSAFDAITSAFSGASAPATACSGVAVKGQSWLDTSVTPNLLKQYNGTSWVVIGALDTSWTPPIGGGTASITAATTTDICAAPAAVQSISGTTPITGFGSSCVAGQRKTLIFNAATPITYNASSMIIPAQRDFVAAAGDMLDAIYLGSGNWRIVAIYKIDGSAVTNPAVALGTIQYGTYATAPAKSVLGFGQALSRTSYPDYFTAVTRVQAGTLTNTNATITGLTNTAGLGAGMPVEGTGIQSGTVIVSVTSSTIVMSKTATASGSQSVSVVLPGYGSGGDSTTVGVQDCRDVTVAGRGNMGGVDRGLLTSTYFGANPLTLGVLGGSESSTHTIAKTNLPNYALSQNLTTTIFGRLNNIAVSSGPLSVVDLISQSGGGGTTGGSFGASGSITLDGSSTPILLSKVSPTVIAECVVVVLP